MKLVFIIITFLFSVNTLVSCRSAKKLQSAINNKDSTVTAKNSPPVTDSAKEAENIKENIKKNYIDYETFSAKIKVDYSDSRGGQPDANAFVRIKKDSVIWISVNATLFNVEVLRILINKDSIWIMNKLAKTMENHALDYLEKVVKIPLNFNTLQELIVGNPVFFGEKIVRYTKAEDRITLSTTGEFFNNLVTLTANDYLLQTSKLDDLNSMLNRTANLTYADYENKSGFYFSTFREITVMEKTRVNIILNYKQYEFNKEVSFPFNISKNYKTK